MRRIVCAFKKTAMPSNRFVLAALAIVASTLTGCATRYIPNTDVEDNEENRKIIAFCEKYRHAVEEKDLLVLMKLASPDYYATGGNVDPRDDIDYAGLQDYLSGAFQDAKAIRYEIRYRRILRDEEDQDRIFIDYTYSASYRIPGLKGEEWRRKVEDNRLELEPHQDEFRILTGM
jgi:hypothetical protein